MAHVMSRFNVAVAQQFDQPKSVLNEFDSWKDPDDEDDVLLQYSVTCSYRSGAVGKFQKL